MASRGADVQYAAARFVGIVQASVLRMCMAVCVRIRGEFGVPVSSQQLG
jgi:hypothetical protein